MELLHASFPSFPSWFSVTFLSLLFLVLLPLTELLVIETFPWVPCNLVFASKVMFTFFVNFFPVESSSISDTPVVSLSVLTF